MPFLANWRTTAASLIPVVLAAIELFAGIDIPGFSLTLAEAFPIAMAGFLARDAAAPKLAA
jgi:hypothetical protein